MFPLVLALAAIGFAGCSSATVTRQTDYANGPVAKPVMVYVADFDLQVEKIEKGKSVLSDLPGPDGPVRARLLGQSNHPEKLAAHLVNLMADSLVKDLTHAGFASRRLIAGEPLPVDGWLVRGVFTEVQQGNRLRRAIIGFGMGKTDMQVVTSIDNLANGQPKPLYEMESDANSGKLPGAAATIVISPFSVPIRFVLSGRDLDKDTKKTAAQITDIVKQRVLTGK